MMDKIKSLLGSPSPEREEYEQYMQKLQAEDALRNQYPQANPYQQGQLRGLMSQNLSNNTVVIGDYMLWEMEDKSEIGVGYRVTGEMGVFKVDDFEPYIKAFFGLNF